MSRYIEAALPAILGREQSFLHDEIAAARSEIEACVSNARVLVIGASGSIGGAFVRVLADYPVQTLHLVDISESNLAELVRDFRSEGVALPEDFKTFAIDFSGPEMRALLKAEAYDYVLNFAALKHVRSERDPFTLMRLLEVNVLANDALCKELIEQGNTKMVFGVSSDKSVRPASMMGASKAFMERVFLNHSDRLPFTSARFANVAFSDGSLLHAFCQRLEKKQPLSAPSDVRRYFISHREAGELCLLGCFLGKNREIVFPKLDQNEDMLTFSEIAKIVLEKNGFEPYECSSEEEAREMASKLTDDSKVWPCYFSPSDTSGEKMYEEFNDPREATDMERYGNMGIVTEPIACAGSVVEDAMTKIKSLRNQGSWSKQELVDIVQTCVPELEHVETKKNLDEKM